MKEEVEDETNQFADTPSENNLGEDNLFEEILGNIKNTVIISLLARGRRL